ncbi:helix-turn-helix transcriptional regulator [Microcoleus sp. K1-B6]|uniref:helix-turn-helix transcriptional regulator n=1 Tax=unclassified Microcoleus TaxID=2642155 RepID=UPI002FD638FE
MSRKKPNQDPNTKPALQVLREAVGLTQSQLASQIPDKTGAKTLTRQAISNWERGLDAPELTIPQVKALCHALGKNLNELPDNLGPPKRSSSDDVGDAPQENKSGD